MKGNDVVVIIYYSCAKAVVVVDGVGVLLANGAPGFLPTSLCWGHQSLVWLEIKS